MILVGSTGRNSGKTEMTCALVRRFLAQRGSGRIVALKVSTIHSETGECPRGEHGCGVCRSLKGPFQLTEEKSTQRSKDTSRILAAGAHKVFWLRARVSALSAGFSEFLNFLRPDDLVICESNSLRTVVVPAIFFLLENTGTADIKQSANRLIHLVDLIAHFDGHTFDFDLADISMEKGRFLLRDDATALILAGGKSSRMQSDKALLPVAGTTMIEHIIRQLSPLFHRIVVSANDLEKYSFLKVPVVRDSYADAGPLAGIVSGLENSASERIFVTACDIPRIDVDLIRRMLRLSSEHEIIVPKLGNGHIEPLYAVYRKHVLERAKALLERGIYRIRELYGQCDTVYVPVENDDGLTNINTSREYEAFLNAGSGLSIG